MPSETPFRLALFAVLAATMLVAGYHRYQAAKARDRLDRRQEGLLLAVVLRLAGLVTWLSVFAYLIHPASMAWAQLPLPDWLRWVGAGWGALGCLLIYWTLRNLGKNLTDTVVTRAAATLVRSGPYRYVRHPFYGSVACVLIAATLLTANWFIGLGAISVLGLLVARTTKEEQKLLERFGDGYRDLMLSTGRFLPSFRPRPK